MVTVVVKVEIKKNGSGALFHTKCFEFPHQKPTDAEKELSVFMIKKFEEHSQKWVNEWTSQLSENQTDPCKEQAKSIIEEMSKNSEGKIPSAIDDILEKMKGLESTGITPQELVTEASRVFKNCSLGKAMIAKGVDEDAMECVGSRLARMVATLVTVNQVFKNTSPTQGTNYNE